MPNTSLRSGYTTGSCAAAAAKAATAMLFGSALLDQVSITLPVGKEVTFPVTDCMRGPDEARCAVLKDAGDDPDVTHGLRIFARVQPLPVPEVVITGGEGVGRVTMPGLAVPVGEPAINPVPRKMILQEVASILPRGKGARVEIYVPGGEEVALRTMNPRLGILGGISILGTSGIVTPMSNEAVKDSLVLALSQIQARGFTSAVLVPGRQGERFAEEVLGLDAACVALSSNYIGFMLESAPRYGINSILLVGNIGKLVKVAGGVFDTHSHVADARREILGAHYALYSNNLSALENIMNATTTEDSLKYIEHDDFYTYLANEVARRATEFTHGDIDVQAVLYSSHRGLLGKSDGVEKMKKNFNP